MACNTGRCGCCGRAPEWVVMDRRGENPCGFASVSPSWLARAAVTSTVDGGPGTTDGHFLAVLKPGSPPSRFRPVGSLARARMLACRQVPPPQGPRGRERGLVSHQNTHLLRRLHGAPCVRTSFLFTAEQYASVWMDRRLCVRSPTDGHVGGFHLLETELCCYGPSHTCFAQICAFISPVLSAFVMCLGAELLGPVVILYVWGH